MRTECPPENIGKVFGTINETGRLEGSILSPDYCIVYGDCCERHQRIVISIEDKP